MQRICSKCNSPVSQDGICHACLMQLGLSQSGPANTDQPWARTLPSIEEIASQFPQLEITKLIGRGGMGAIYLARQTALDRDVALKIIAKEVSEDAMFVERFEREAKTLAKLSHPNIVTVYDFGRTASGMAYLIMEFVDGVNLREALATKSVGAEDALGLIATMCQALDYAHSKGVVHRDIKPENILLGEDGSLKIADFGIAKIVDDTKRSPTLTATRQVLGSLHYLAPEQIESPEQVDHRVDLYALGVIFYELLTGQLPLGNFEPPSSISPRLDKRIDAIVLKTLSRRPANRYQNASQLKSDIEQINSASFVPPVVSGSDWQKPQLVSVPFHMETYAGFGKIFGSIQSTGTSVKIEYRVTDGIFQTIKSQLHTLEIPLDMLNQVKLDGKYFTPKIIISTHSAALLGDLPRSESGRVELKVERNDRELAEKVVAALGFAPTSPNLVSSDSYWNPTQAVLLIICSLMNGGVLAAIMAYLHSENEDAHAVPAIVASVLYGNVMLLQLVGAILHITNRFVFPYRAAMITALIPYTPVVLFSAPLAIWYFIDQSSWKAQKGTTTGNAKSWGETTMIFIRENRAARWFSILNIVGLVILVLSAAVYLTGVYPTSLRYRIVGGTQDDVAQTELIAKRLADYPGARLRSSGSNRIEVVTWARDLNAVKNCLRITKSPSLVAILAKPSKDPTSAEDFNCHSIAEGLETTKFLTKKSAAEILSVACLPTEMKLASDLVKEISRSPSSNSLSDAIKLELTSAGRKSVTELLSLTADADEKIAAIGLMIDGVVQGIAELDDQSTQRLNLVLSKTLRVEESGLSAAIRGPELPFDLELLP